MLRIHNSLFSSYERRLLIRMAKALPASVTPDMVTAFGIFGGFVTLVGYILAHWSVGYLWLASLGLVLHWAGDSLDGTLARVRQIERPKYGYFVDQTVDVVGNLLIALGMGLSPFVRMDTAMIALAGYHALSIFSYVRTCVSGVFHVALLGSGPTEIRMLIIGMNCFILLFGAPELLVFGIRVTWCDLALLAMASVFHVAFVCLVVAHAASLKDVDRQDQAERHSPERAPHQP